MKTCSLDNMDKRIPLLVTVYVPTYMKFDVIYNNLRSILEQNYSDIELIVSDDGSTNFPKEDIETYIVKNRRENIKSFQVIANKNNVGTVRHINKILSLAHGDLYIPLSGDDEFYNNTVITRIVAEYNKTHFNVLSTSRITVDNEGHQLYFIPHILDRVIINLWIRTARQQLNRLLQRRYHNFASGSTMTIQASFFKQMGGHDERFVLWEDGPFIAKITNMGYRISTRYDIISVRYKLGGISTGGSSGEVGQVYSKDLAFFRSNSDCYKQSPLTRRIIRWRKTYPKSMSLSFRIKFLDLFILQKLSSIYDRLSYRYDKWRICD